MKILLVCSSLARKEGYFTLEQAEDLSRAGHITEFFFIRGRGLFGYIGSWIPLIMRILAVKPDIVHAHYGLSAFIAVMQPLRPVVMTVHGGDINDRRISWLTKAACRFAQHVIIVNADMRPRIKRKTGVTLLPCAVNLSLFSPVSRQEARARLKMNTDEKIVLFASRFDKKVKNETLAQKAIALSKNKPWLVELNRRPREEMPLLINAVDVLLLTSFSEGSPQIVKEAMACNVPVVSTDVGDIRSNCSDLEGYYISGFDASLIALNIDKAIAFRRSGSQTKGRDRIVELGLDADTITKQLIDIYNVVLENYRRR